MRDSGVRYYTSNKPEIILDYNKIKSGVDTCYKMFNKFNEIKCLFRLASYKTVTRNRTQSSEKIFYFEIKNQDTV